MSLRPSQNAWSSGVIVTGFSGGIPCGPEFGASGNGLTGNGCVGDLHGTLLGAPAFPEPGQYVPFFYVSFVAIDQDDKGVFEALLREVYNDSVGSSFRYAMVGLHERDPLLAAMKDYSLTPFAGRLFCVCFVDGEQGYRTLDGRVPYVEAATL